MPAKTPSPRTSTRTSSRTPARPSWVDLPDHGAVDVSQALAQINRIEDPRQAGKVAFPLQHLLLFALAATLSQFDSFELMATWSATHGHWLIEQMHLSALPRMPSHDTFRHLFRLLKPGHLERLVRSVTQAQAGSLEERLVLIDGKALGGTWGPKADKAGALKLLNAYLPDVRLTLGTHAVGAATNESAQLPAFINGLHLKGTTVCIDAAGTYKDVAGAINKQQAQYILTLKANQPTLHAKVECFFQQADKHHGKVPDIHTARLKTRSKGRQVEVQVETCDWLDWLEETAQWPGLRSVTRLQRWRIDEYGTRHHTTMYLLSSLTGAKAILRGAVSRWAIENSLHWVLDVSFAEDACRTRDLNASHNLALLRRLAGNLLKLEGSKLSIKGKRLLCASSRTFLCNVLNAFNVHA